VGFSKIRVKNFNRIFHKRAVNFNQSRDLSLFVKSGKVRLLLLEFMPNFHHIQNFEIRRRSFYIPCGMQLKCVS
jgi:hypothetical protein